MYYVEFREDYLALCLDIPLASKHGKKSKASPYCMALMLSILEHWTNEKRGKGDDLSVFMSYAQWHQEMFGMFGRTVIITSIDALLVAGLITRAPYKMFGRDTFQYLLHVKAVNGHLRLLPDRDPHMTRPQVNGSTSNSDPSINECDPSTSKRVTGPQVNGSRPKVDDDPSKSNYNIESIIDSTQTPIIDSTQESAAIADTPRTPEKGEENDGSSNIPTIGSRDNGSIRSGRLSDATTALTQNDTTPRTAERLEAVSPLVNPKTRMKPARHTPATPPTVVLSEQEQAFYDLYCSLPWMKVAPPITDKVKEQCARLAPHLTTQEQLYSLRTFMAKKDFFKRKGFGLAMLAYALNDWAMEQVDVQGARKNAPPPESETEKQKKLARAQAALASLRAAQPVGLGV